MVFVVSDNRAAEELLPVVQGFAELMDSAEPGSIVTLPTRDVLPFQNLSPHPEIQEERAAALWKIASGAVSIVIAPIAATTIRLASTEYYIDLARIIRRGETIDTEPLLEHLNTVGYASADVVEMPGQYALRGGILDVYSPEADRPVRIEFFGDEVESIRKFDPATQRSSSPVDEALLLPLTETPVREDLLGAIHVRLSGKRITGNEEVIEQAVRSGGVTVFPGWEFYAPVARESRSLFDLLPHATVLADEPEALKQELDRIWARIEEAHERSLIGNLVRPTDLYFPPEQWWQMLNGLAGRGPRASRHHAARPGGSRAVSFAARSALPRLCSRHARRSAEADAERTRTCVFAAPNTGEVERLADIFTEYNVSFRLGSRTRGGESYADETAYFSATCSPPRSSKPTCRMA